MSLWAGLAGAAREEEACGKGGSCGCSSDVDSILPAVTVCGQQHITASFAEGGYISHSGRYNQPPTTLLVRSTHHMHSS